MADKIGVIFGVTSPPTKQNNGVTREAMLEALNTLIQASKPGAANINPESLEKAQKIIADGANEHLGENDFTSKYPRGAPILALERYKAQIESKGISKVEVKNGRILTSTGDLPQPNQASLLPQESNLSTTADNDNSNEQNPTGENPLKLPKVWQRSEEPAGTQPGMRVVDPKTLKQPISPQRPSGERREERAYSQQTELPGNYEPNPADDLFYRPDSSPQQTPSILDSAQQFRQIYQFRNPPDSFFRSIMNRFGGVTKTPPITPTMLAGESVGLSGGAIGTEIAGGLAGAEAATGATMAGLGSAGAEAGAAGTTAAAGGAVAVGTTAPAWVPIALVVGAITLLVLFVVLISPTGHMIREAATPLGGQAGESTFATYGPGPGACWPFQPIPPAVASITQDPSEHAGHGQGDNNGQQGSAIDIAMPEGTPIYSSVSGFITRSAMDTTGYGKLIILHGDNGTDYYYAHLSVILVRVGQRIEGVTQIGESGNTGESTGPHLHFETRNGLNIREVIPSTLFIDLSKTCLNLSTTLEE